MAKTTRHGGGTNNKAVAPIVTHPQSRQQVGETGPEVVQVPEDISVEPAPGEVSDYNDLTVNELRDQLEARKLSTAGKKSELVDRLLDDDTAPDTGE